MAVVYLARDRKHDRPVAVKVLRPEVLAGTGAQRFLREIQILARLQHPHILALLDSGTSQEPSPRPFYVMPYVEGESLRQRLTREGPLPMAEALRLVREIGEALHYAHGQGLIHRDVKPENVLLSQGHALVADFGIARALDAAAGDNLHSPALPPAPCWLGKCSIPCRRSPRSVRECPPRFAAPSSGRCRRSRLTGSRRFRSS
jgi:serine/threonine-protein kinase